MEGLKFKMVANHAKSFQPQKYKMVAKSCSCYVINHFEATSIAIYTQNKLFITLLCDFMTYNDVHREILWLQGPSMAIFTMSVVKIRE